MLYDYDRRTAGSRYYHGTSSDFDTFDLTKSGERDFGDFGFGVYLTPSSRLARMYAYDSAKKTRREPKVLATRVQARKTADLDDPALQKEISETLGIPFPDKVLHAGAVQTRPRAEALAITEFLRKRGFDSGLGRGGMELVVYDPRLINIERVYTSEDFDMLY